MMKAQIKLYKNDGEAKEGYPVKLILSHNRKIKRRILFHSPLEDWDLISELPEMTHDDFEEIYGRIMDYRKKSIKLSFKEMDDFDKAFDYLLESKRQKRYSFYEWADKRVSFMRKMGRDGNAEAYLFSKNELAKFWPKLDFEDVTPTLLENFKAYKKADGLKNTSVKKYLVELRAIYNSAVKVGIIEDRKPFTGLFNDLPIQKRRLRNRYLSEEGITKLEKLELSHLSYQRAIDFSLLQFYFCGVDLVDLYYLKNEDIDRNRVFFKRRKLGEKGYEFDMLLPEKAKKIMDKYTDYKDEYVFSWRKDYMGYKTFRNNHNRNLKILQKRLQIKLSPKDDNLTTKVMRHTFATLGKFARIEEDLLRELMGHERNDIDTIYKDKYPELERDKAQLKIITVKSLEVD